MLGRPDVIELIAESPEAHGVYEEAARTAREVVCKVESVGMQETYTALSSGLHPEKRFVLPHYAEYQGEKLLRHEGVLYDIIRVYQGGQAVELTAERSSHV